MVNDDDFSSDDKSDLDHGSLEKEVERLRALTDDLKEQLWEKDRLLEQYWETIQSMRLINRLKRIMMPWRSTDVAIRNHSSANPNASTRNSKSSKKSICIKIAAYNWKVAHTWGDFYFAIGIRKALVRLGYRVLIQTLDEWYDGNDKEAAVILVIRGLTRYEPRNGKALHLIWNISHPADVPDDEYASFDHVFVASEFWANEVRRRVGEKVSSLLQCTDLSVFKRATFPIKSEVLFVGNARGILRPVIADMLQTQHNLSIYGNGWENVVPRKYLKGSFVEHSRLYRYYSGADILLNDHWEDMRRSGFISNRIYDALACGAFVISDHVEGIESVFGEGVVTYKSGDNLRDLVDYYLKNQEERNKIASAGRKKISEEHTFTARAFDIHHIIKTALG